MKYCTYCGAALDDKAVVCPRCFCATNTRPIYQQGSVRGALYCGPQFAAPVVNIPQPLQQIPYTQTPYTQTAYAQSPYGADRFGKEVVKVQGLYKRYSKKADWAVTDVSFTCREGEIVGLLGHNGAGKSTTLKCLEGMLPYERGEIKIAGYDIRKQPEAAKAQMGFVTDNHATFIKMTGVQYLNFMADVYEVPSGERMKRLKELDAIFQLGKPISNLISSYSHGMRQKICMMGSLIHRPKLWILDEPMTGLDPRTMRAVQDFMHRYVAEGNAIIFSSHALNTVAKLCDRVVLIRRGRQVNELDVKSIYASNPNFDFEEYFLRNEQAESEGK